MLTGLVVTTYGTVNRFAAGISGEAEKVAVGVEPILFGLLAVGWDLLLLGAKRLFIRMVDDAKNRN